MSLLYIVINDNRGIILLYSHAKQGTKKHYNRVVDEVIMLYINEPKASLYTGLIHKVGGYELYIPPTSDEGIP